MLAAKYTLIFNRKQEVIKPGRKYLVQIRVYFQGKNKFISTGIYLESNQWNEKDKLVKMHPAALDFNVFLRNRVNELQKFEHSTRNKGMEFTFAALDMHLKGIDKLNFLEYMEGQISARADISRQTRVHHTTMLTRLKEHGKIMNINDLKYDNIVDLDNWFINKGLNQSTIYTLHKILKVYINRAIKSGILELSANPYLKFKVTKVNNQYRKYLTKEELTRIESQEFDGRVAIHRDLFLFSCYTGLAYSDAAALTNSNLIEENGELWLMNSRLKTEKQYVIMLLPKALAIIKKYSGIKPGRLLPYISNQKMNNYLKFIQDICGIKKELTTHVARHTFATTVTLANGVSLEVLQKMLGHTSIQTTEIYAKLMNSRIQKEMNILKGNLEKFGTTQSTKDKSIYDGE